MQKVATDNKDDFPQAAKAVFDSFNVDDFLKSFASVDKAIEVMTKLVEMMKRVGFNLTKFITNSESVFESKHGDIAFANPSFSDVGSVSVLGLNWDTRDDTFSVSRGVSNDLPAKLTQQKILSSVSSVYDPLGIVAPFTNRGRLILKELWCGVGQSWDTVVPQNINDLFHEWNGEKDVIPKREISSFYFYSVQSFKH